MNTHFLFAYTIYVYAYRMIHQTYSTPFLNLIMNLFKFKFFEYSNTYFKYVYYLQHLRSILGVEVQNFFFSNQNLYFFILLQIVKEIISF